jgi:NADH dehydrogenase
MNHQVVIIGGGFGGLYAARQLKHADVQVTLIDRRNFHLFQPLLYQVATGSLSPANIATPLRYILKKQENARVLMAEAVRFDLNAKKVILTDGEVPYDTLILAPGSRHNYFGHDAWNAYAPGLKSVEEATEIRQKIFLAFENAEREQDLEKRKAWLTFVVVGAGPTGVELAGALGEIARDTLAHEFRAIHTSQARILLIDAVDRVLSTYPEDLSAKAEKALNRLGVEVQTKTSVIDIRGGELIIKHEGREESIASKTILWAAGVQASPLVALLAKSAGVPVEKGGRVAVQTDLTLPGHPDIFVIGDAAQFRGADGNMLPGTAPVAIQEGRYAAQKIAARLNGAQISPFEYRHRGDMATIGRASAVAHIGRWKMNGFLAWLSWLFVHLLYLVEYEDRILVLLQWSWNYFTYNRGARLITGDHPVDAKSR